MARGAVPTSGGEAPHPLDERKGGVRSANARKLGKDGPSWTPTEQRARDKALKQFCRAGRKGVQVSSGNSQAYKEGYDGIDWGNG